jgi:hypothetical protein
MNVEWTHKGAQITDIRKVRKFYIISIDDDEVTSPLFVDHGIFEGRVNSYYLKGSGSNISNDDIIRQEVTAVKWNMVVNKGFFIKSGSDGVVEKIEKDPGKFYISFLEIDGPLGTHISS